MRKLQSLLNANADKGKLPSQIIPNPNIGSSSSSSSYAGNNLKPCQGVTVLRSGKEIEKPEIPLPVQEEEEIEEGTEKGKEHGVEQNAEKEKEVQPQPRVNKEKAVKTKDYDSYMTSCSISTAPCSAFQK